MNPLGKLGAYDLIVTLVPGVLLLEALRASGYPIVVQSELATYVALSYVLGLLSSRTGSFFVSPLAKIFSAKDHSYDDFIEAEMSDSKISTLLQTANGYRSLAGGAVCYFMISLFYWIWLSLELGRWTGMATVVGAIGLLFFASYLKQNSYISKRVKKVVDGND